MCQIISTIIFCCSLLFLFLYLSDNGLLSYSVEIGMIANKDMNDDTAFSLLSFFFRDERFFLHATNVYLIDDVISTSSSKTNSLGFSRHSSLVWQTMMNRDGDAGIFFFLIFFFPGRTVFLST